MERGAETHFLRPCPQTGGPYRRNRNLTLNLEDGIPEFRLTFPKLRIIPVCFGNKHSGHVFLGSHRPRLGERWKNQLARLDFLLNFRHEMVLPMRRFGDPGIERRLRQKEKIFSRVPHHTEKVGNSNKQGAEPQRIGWIFPREKIQSRPYKRQQYQISVYNNETGRDQPQSTA